ncbi:response regulator [Haloferula rosea]|uniref:Response regulator n=1 Tax=Haloferula rosea TaxID=490093 RepID=A0A934VCW0_9BACT|nr:response regulator [Haloferula rosea]MBK1825649.1 response regulator [Haloferula rosea]
MNRSATASEIQKVLVVDDEESIRGLFELALESEGRTARSCSSGRAALDLVGRDSFDLILLDLRMPGLSGIDVLREMRRMADKTRVVICSAFIPPMAFVEAVRFGVTTFVAKPVTLNVLRRVVSDALESRWPAPLCSALRLVNEMRHEEALEAISEAKDETNHRACDLWVRLLDGILSNAPKTELAPLGQALGAMVLTRN